ncbi:RNA-directed DNA polymerase, eukaryota, reverse transcriptase zinc-binding domain protein [Tanacetum coccineum]
MYCVKKPQGCIPKESHTNDGIANDNGMVQFKKKLQHLKNVIRGWLGSKKAVSLDLKNKHLDQLSSIDVKVDLGIASEEDFKNRRDSLLVLGDLERVEVKYIAQKARIKWALEGDENTSFFHGMLKKKRRQLAIKGILKNGDLIENPSMVKAEFLGHFSSQFQQPNGIPPSLDSEFLNPISSSKREFLERPFSRGEIKKAVWDCGGDRAPGPDGFTFKFFTTFWDLIENDVIRFVHEYFRTNLFPKVLAWHRQRKKELMVFKVDFEKAFDSLRWDFLDLILDKLGFGSTWRAWIRGCLYNSRSSVLVNGSQTEEFVIHRGLRQGDPIFFCDQSDLWIRVIKSIHGPGGGINSDTNTSLKRSTWGSILSSINSLKSKGIDLFSYYTHKIGNGLDSSFWSDLWCGNQPLKVMFPRIFLLETDKQCSIASRVGLIDWSSVLRMVPRGGEESSQFNALLSVIGSTSLSDQYDVWHLVDS